MRREAILAGAMLLFPFDAFFGQNAPAKTSRIIGIVVDSIHGTGLEGAEVMVSGFSSAVTTDSLGRFAFEGLAPGTYQVGVFHPLLETLGLTLATKPFIVGRDSTGVANLAIPSVKTLASRYCGSAVTPSHPAVVAGRVLDPDSDEPVRGATISLAWVDMVISKETGIVRTPHELHADTDSSGFFKFCALPEDLDATVQATRSGVWTGEVAISTSGSVLTFESLAIAAPHSAPVKGTVRGTVVSLDNRPIGGARVEAPMTGAAVVTKEDGTFSLNGIPTGTQLLIVRHLGFEPTRISVNVTSRQPTELSVTMGPRVNVMDPVLVTARRAYALEKDGFMARQRSGWGTYFTQDQIETRNPQYLTDILTVVPGIRVVHSPGGATIREERMSSILGGGRGGPCTNVWVDGTQWRTIEPGDIDAFVSPRDVAALEVYRGGTAPVQFRGLNDQCVTLVVWTQMQSQGHAALIK